MVWRLIAPPPVPVERTKVEHCKLELHVRLFKQAGDDFSRFQTDDALGDLHRVKLCDRFPHYEISWGDDIAIHNLAGIHEGLG